MQPPVTAAAMRYFCAVYERRMMMEPQIMTGIILAHLPSVWTGKLTYLSASYWHVVATTLENDTRQYSCIFATCVGGWVGVSLFLSSLHSLSLSLSVTQPSLSSLKTQWRQLEYCTQARGTPPSSWPRAIGNRRNNGEVTARR